MEHILLSIYTIYASKTAVESNPWKILSDTTMNQSGKGFFVNIMSDISGLLMTIGVCGVLITVTVELIRISIARNRGKWSEGKDLITWRFLLLLGMFSASFLLGLLKTIVTKLI